MAQIFAANNGSEISATLKRQVFHDLTRAFDWITCSNRRCDLNYSFAAPSAALQDALLQESIILIDPCEQQVER